MCLFLVLVCIVGCFCSCGKTGNTDTSNSGTSETLKAKPAKTTKQNAKIDKNLASKIKDRFYQEIIEKDQKEWESKVNDPDDMSIPTQLKRKYPFIPGTIRYYMSPKDTEWTNVDHTKKISVPAYTFCVGSNAGYIYYNGDLYYGGVKVEMEEYYFISPVDKYDNINGKVIGQTNNEIVFAFYPERSSPTEPYWCYCIDMSGNSFYILDEHKENTIYAPESFSYNRDEELPLLPFEFDNMEQFLKQFVIEKRICRHALTPSESTREYNFYSEEDFFFRYTEEDIKNNNWEVSTIEVYILKENS